MSKKQLKNEYPIGCLVEFRDIDYKQRDILIKLMSKEYSYMFQLLFSILEDDAAVLQLIDVFADQRIKFPPRKKVYNLLERIKIYQYVKGHNSSETSIQVIAKQHKKRPSQIRNLVKKIDEVMENLEMKDLYGEHTDKYREEE